jgi:hypothetical protein
VTPELHLAELPARIRSLVHAIQDNDEATIEDAIRRLSQSRRWLAPLTFAIGAFLLLFDGLRLMLSNWRLTLIQILPAMWIWVAMYDLKQHALHGRSFNIVRGPILIPIGTVVVALTVASFFLNAVFAFAIASGRPPQIRPAFATARAHWRPILLSGLAVGVLLALSTLVVSRAGRPWFTLFLSVVVGVMMVAYIAVPARLIGAKPKQSRRDKLVTSAVGGAIGATVCGPPYLLGRLGLLMLGSKALLIPGIFVFATGVTLQAGATGAVRAIKMSVKLGVSGDPTPEQAAIPRPNRPSPADQADDALDDQQNSDRGQSALDELGRVATEPSLGAVDCSRRPVRGDHERCERDLEQPQHHDVEADHDHD